MYLLIYPHRQVKIKEEDMDWNTEDNARPKVPEVTNHSKLKQESDWQPEKSGVSQNTVSSSGKSRVVYIDPDLLSKAQMQVSLGIVPGGAHTQKTVTSTKSNKKKRDVDEDWKPDDEDDEDDDDEDDEDTIKNSQYTVQHSGNSRVVYKDPNKSNVAPRLVTVAEKQVTVADKQVTVAAPVPKPSIRPVATPIVQNSVQFRPLPVAPVLTALSNAPILPNRMRNQEIHIIEEQPCSQEDPVIERMLKHELEKKEYHRNRMKR